MKSKYPTTFLQTMRYWLQTENMRRRPAAPLPLAFWPVAAPRSFMNAVTSYWPSVDRALLALLDILCRWKGHNFRLSDTEATLDIGYELHTCTRCGSSYREDIY